MAINFVSGAGAASDAIRQFMAERLARERQEMLDRVVVEREGRLGQSADANTELARQNALSLEETRKATAALNAERVAGEQQQRELAPLAPGDEADPEIAKKYPGFFQGGQVTQGAQLPDDAEGIPQYETVEGKPTYRGTPEQRETERKRQDQESYLQTLDPESAEARYLTAQTRTGDSSIPYQLYEAPKTKVPFRASADRRTIERQDEQSGEWVKHVGAVPENAHWLQEPQPSGGGNTTINMGADAVDLAAWQYLQTGSMPPLGMGNANVRTQILNRAATLAKEGNINPQANAAEYRADSGALTQITRNITAIGAFKNTAKKNIEVLKTTMASIPDAGAAVLNRPWRAVMTATGSPEMAKFKTALGAVQPEIARILTSPNLTGVLSDSARMEAQELLRGDYTVGQLMAALDIIDNDMANRENSLLEAQKAIETSIKSRGPQFRSGGADPNETPEQRRERLKGYLPQ